MTRVLVIDDQRISRVALAGVLGGSGYEVETASEGTQGLQRAREWLPDVIVLDVNMPGMDGFAVVEELKDDADTAPIPVIFLTGEAPTDELIVRGLELGAYDFLSKGESNAELLARVQVMARIKRSHDELAAIARVSNVLIRSADPEELCRTFVEQSREIFRADAAIVRLAGQEDAPVLREAEGIDVEDPLAERLIEGLVEALAERDTEAVAMEPDELRGPAGAFARRRGFHSAIAVHVERAGKSSLLAGVFSRREAGFRHGTDATLLHLLARQAVIAIDNALLHARARRQAKELERALSMRSRFFASVSHELRTPINAVLGYNQVLTQGIYGEMNERQADAVDRIGQSAEHLLDLINDILDLSKIEAGKLEISPEPVDLAVLLRDALNSVRIQAEEKGLELEIDAPDALPAVLDPARVRQIFLNLLSNAVKFTDEGGVRAELEQQEVDGRPEARVRVSDTGPGIEPAHRERIFEEFEQVERPGAPKGTGLGLAISRRLARLMGGDLEVESTVGEGSTFTLRVPVSTEATTVSAG